MRVGDQVQFRVTCAEAHVEGLAIVCPTGCLYGSEMARRSLARLVAEGLLHRVPYGERGQRSREEYRLTGKGLDLYPVLMAWDDSTRSARPAREGLLRRRDCGQPVGL